MKKFWKRMNRGLALALVLVIGLVIYIAVDEGNFRREVPRIEQNLQSYMQQLPSIYVTGEADSAAVPQEQIEQKLKDNVALVQPYWLSTIGSSNGYQYNLDALTQDMQQVLQDSTLGNGYVSKLSYTIVGSPQIRKDGPGLAVVETEYSIVADYVGTPLIGGVAGTIYPDGYGEDLSEYGEEPLRMTVTGYANFHMQRVDGDWKITQIDNLGYGANVTPIAE